MTNVTNDLSNLGPGERPTEPHAPFVGVPAKGATAGVSPKLLAAVITAVLTYLLGQTVLDLPAVAVVIGQAVLVALTAFTASPGLVTTEPIKPGPEVTSGP